MTPLSPLDILIIVSTLVIACVGVYLIIILSRVSHMTRVADRFAQTIEKFQDVFAIIDDIPTNIIRKITDSFPKNKK
jgi:flagellar basal body-associated protein FliL